MPTPRWTPIISGPLRTIRAFAPILGRNGGGAVVNILSHAGRESACRPWVRSARPRPQRSASRRRREHIYAAQGTHVLAVLPGAVDTDMSRGHRCAENAGGIAVADAVIDGLERGLEEIYPGDMAAGVAFGRVMDVEGGRARVRAPISTRPRAW